MHVALQRHNLNLQAQLREQEERQRQAAHEVAARSRRVQAVLDSPELTMAFQPIVDLATRAVVGVEALARFAGAPVRPPDQWFAEAVAVGLGTELELRALEVALAQLGRLPAELYMSVNVSPATVVDERLARLLAPCPARRLVIELTEHAPVHEYAPISEVFRSFRRFGWRMAVDDAGSGYSGLTAYPAPAPRCDQARPRSRAGHRRRPRPARPGIVPGQLFG